MRPRPTDDTLALVAFLAGGEWLSADEIRHGAAALGFPLPSIQWTVSRLVSMCEEMMPRFEVTDTGLGWHEYRVTHFAHTGLRNRFPGFTTADHEKQLREVGAALKIPH